MRPSRDPSKGLSIGIPQSQLPFTWSYLSVVAFYLSQNIIKNVDDRAVGDRIRIIVVLPVSIVFILFLRLYLDEYVL